MYFLEKYFAIGTKHKKVYVFDSNNMNKPTYTVNFDDGIKDIKFWYPGKILILFNHNISLLPMTNKKNDNFCI